MWQVSSGLQQFPGAEFLGGPARVVSVVYGGPAHLSGICAGDIIRSVNGISSEKISEVMLNVCTQCILMQKIHFLLCHLSFNAGTIQKSGKRCTSVTLSWMWWIEVELLS